MSKYTYAKDDLSNVSNDNFLSKAVTAGISGGSGSSTLSIDYEAEGKPDVENPQVIIITLTVPGDPKIMFLGSTFVDCYTGLFLKGIPCAYVYYTQPNPHIENTETYSLRITSWTYNSSTDTSTISWFGRIDNDSSCLRVGTATLIY